MTMSQARRKKIDMSKIFSYYVSLLKENQSSHTNYIEYKEFKYYFEDPNKVLKMLSSLGDLRTKNNQLILSSGNNVSPSVNHENIKRNNYSIDFDEKKRQKNYSHNNELIESRELLGSDNEKIKQSEKLHKNNLDFRQKKDVSLNSKQHNVNLPLQQNLTFNYNNSLNTHESNYSLKMNDNFQGNINPLSSKNRTNLNKNRNNLVDDIDSNPYLNSLDYREDNMNLIGGNHYNVSKSPNIYNKYLD